MSDARSEQFWEARLGGMLNPSHSWYREAARTAVEAEARRVKARFNTGSITLTAAIALRSIAVWAAADTVIEVGTFIGNSTLALKSVARTVYTCDFSNDCFEGVPGIVTYPHKTGRQMFQMLTDQKVIADFAFFDGRLGPDDPKWLAKIMTPETVYVFDDYEGQEKGTCNVQLLQPHLPDHVLIVPCGLAKPETTLAVLVPKGRL